MLVDAFRALTMTMTIDATLVSVEFDWPTAVQGLTKLGADASAGWLKLVKMHHHWFIV